MIVYLALYGRKLGYSLIALVSFWDLFYTGIRGFYEYSISYKGVVAIWIGLLIIILSFKAEKELGGR